MLFLWKQLRIVWTELFFLYNLQYWVSILPMLWPTVTLLSKFKSASSILSFALQCCEKVGVPLTWSFCWHCFLWDMHPFHHNHSVYANKSIFTKFLCGCISGAHWIVALSKLPQATISSVTPLMSSSNPT